VGEPEPSDEPRGTQVSLACQPGDEALFRDRVHDNTIHWDVRPDIKGQPEFEWNEPNYLLRGDRWDVIKGHYHSQPYTALVDGIPYPIDSRKINGDTPEEKKALKLAFASSSILHFDVADVGVTASRESLDYKGDTIVDDDGTTRTVEGKTIASVKRRLIALAEGLASACISEISNAPSLWDANMKFLSFPNHIREAADGATWQGFQTSGNFPMGAASMIEYTFADKKGVTNVSKDTTCTFRFPELKSKITRTFLHDDKHKHPARAKLLWLAEQGVEVVRILVRHQDSPDYEKTLDRDEEGHGLRTLLGGLALLSEVPRLETPATERKPRRRPPKVKRYSSGYWRDADGEFDLEGDDPVVFVQLYANNPHALPGLQNSIASWDVTEYAGKLGVPVVGVQPTYIKRVPDHWTWLGHAIKAKLRDALNGPNAEAALACNAETSDMHRWHASRIYDLAANGSVTLPPEGLLDKWRQEGERAADLLREKNHLAKLAELARENLPLRPVASPMGAIKKAVQELMPFIFCLQSTSLTPSLVKEIQWYVDAKEAEAKKAGLDPARAFRAERVRELRAQGHSWRQIEASMDLTPNNGMSAVRLSKD
jgi:hypothetical protein